MKAIIFLVSHMMAFMFLSNETAHTERYIQAVGKTTSNGHLQELSSFHSQAAARGINGAEPLKGKTCFFANFSYIFLSLPYKQKYSSMAIVLRRLGQVTTTSSQGLIPKAQPIKSVPLTAKQIHTSFQKPLRKVST